MNFVRCTVVALMLLGAPAMAEAQAAPPVATMPAPAAGEWIGTWTGTFTYGTMTLTLGREGAAWNVGCVFEGEGFPSGEVRMWSIQGRAFSWLQTVGPYDLFVRGTLEDGVLKGSFELYVDGVYGGTESFQLKKAG